MYSCLSVLTGWQTVNNQTGELFGPTFARISDLWKWQSAHLYN